MTRHLIAADTTIHKIMPKDAPSDKAPQAKDRETERWKPMQLWANYLHSLKAGANVIPLRGHGAA